MSEIELYQMILKAAKKIGLKFFWRGNYEVGDLAGDMMVKILVHKDQFDSYPQADLQRILYTAAKNIAVNKIKKDVRLAETPFDDLVLSASAKNNDISDFNFEKDFKLLYGLVADRLGEVNANILKMVVVDNFNYGEIGKIFGISRAAICNRVKKIKHFCKLKNKVYDFLN